MTDTTKISSSAADIAHNNPPPDNRSRRKPLPLASLVVWPPAEEQANDLLAAGLEDEIAIIAEGEQRAPLPARVRADGSVEVIAKWHIGLALQQYIAQDATRSDKIEVLLMSDSTDATAYRWLAQDAEAGKRPSAYSRGLLFERAVKEFGSEIKAAEQCRVAKSTVSKNLDVVRCLPIIGEKIAVHRDIGRDDAIWLMQNVGRSPDGDDAPDKAIRQTILDQIAAAERAPAKVIFSALRKSVRESGKEALKNREPLKHGGEEIGYIKLARGKPIGVSFGDIGDLPPKDIGRAVADAIARVRSGQ